MVEPMSDERLTEIQERAESVRTWKAVWGAPIPQLCDVDVPALLAEVDRLRAELADARKGKVEAQLDRLDDWSGDLAAVVAERDQARADVKALAIEVDRLSDAAAVSANAARTLRSRVEAARATAAELHDPTSPDGDCVELCIGCRLERDLDGETGGRS